MGFGTSSGGANVSVYAAENLSTVLACVGAISSTIATLPAFVYRKGAGGRVEAVDHAVTRLIHRPNAHLTWPDFLEMMIAQALLHGNAMAVIEHDGAGQVTGLVPVPWPNVTVTLLPGGRMAYDVTSFTAPWGGTGVPRRYLDSEVFHLRDRSDNGLTGRSRLSRAPEVLTQAFNLQLFTGTVWSNGASPSGVLKSPHQLTSEAAERVQDSFIRAYAGPLNARKTILLDGGLEFQPFP